MLESYLEGFSTGVALVIILIIAHEYYNPKDNKDE